MKRRNFIKNTGLSLAGLALSNSILSKSLPAKKSLNVIILMSGGVNFYDIIDENNNRISVFFNENADIELCCKTKLYYSGKNLEHSDAVLNALHPLKGNPSEYIFISDLNSNSTKTVVESKLPITLVTTKAHSNLEPYRNDAAIFEKAMHYIEAKSNTTIILNIEDTDIAHFEKQKYYDVLQYYNHQIENVCKTVFSSNYRNECNTKISLISVIGRNNFSNEIYNKTNQAGTDHYDETARKLFSIDIAYAENYQLKFDHVPYDSKNLLRSTNGLIKRAII
jgi:hypothetical protein